MIVFRNVCVVDGQFDEARPGLDVIIDGDRIAAVEPTDPERTLPAGTNVIDGTGSALLPGLIDCSVHYAGDPAAGGPASSGRDDSEARRVLHAAANARRALEAGVTTAMSGGARGGLDILLRDAIAGGLVPGPRMLAAGPVLTITGGHGREYGREVDGPDAFVGAVRANVRDGADVIAIVAGAAAPTGRGGSAIDEMTDGEVEATVREASRHGRRVVSYAENTEAVERSIWSGAAAVVGGMMADETVHGIFAGRDIAFVPRLVATDLRRDGAGSTPRVPGEDDRAEAHRRTVEAAIERGVRMAAGTGCGVDDVAPDMLAREIRLLHEHGASPIDAIRSATQWAAELLGLADVVGFVRVGHAADLVLVAGDPLVDLRNLERPTLVVRAGRVVHRAA